MTADPSATLAAVAERELLARAQGGDAEAFDGVVRRHLARARVVALRLMQNVEDADDLVQDAFLRALERQAPYTSKGDSAQLRNASDGIYNRGGSELLLTPTASGTGYAATLNIGLDVSA